MLLKWFVGAYSAKARRLEKNVSPTEYSLEIYGPEGDALPLVSVGPTGPFCP